MMAEFDLIPPDYARGRILRRRMKALAIVLASVACLVAIAWLGLHSLISAESGKAARLQQAKQLSVKGEAAAQEYRQRKQAVERQLAALDELRGRDRVRIFVRAIDAAYVEGVWFDALRFYRREQLPAGDPRGSAAAPGRARAGAQNAAPRVATPAEIEHYAEIAGHAVNHSALAEFIRRLGHQPGIADVRLIDSGMRAHAEVAGIDARISLSIDPRGPQ